MRSSPKHRNKNVQFCNFENQVSMLKEERGDEVKLIRRYEKRKVHQTLHLSYMMFHDCALVCCMIFGKVLQPYTRLGDDCKRNEENVAPLKS